MTQPNSEQKPAGGKIFHLLQKTLSQFKDALREELYSSHATDQVSPAPASAVTEQVTDVDTLIETSDGIDQEVEALHDHHGMLGRQLNAMLNLTPEEKHRAVSFMWRTLAETEEILTTIQDANSRLRRLLCEKRLLLDTRNKALSDAQRQEFAHLTTIETLRRSNYQLTRDLSACQDKLAHQEQDMARLQYQFDTLSQQHDALVGEYHQRFQATFRKA